MIDIHSHILSNVDDGAIDLDMSIRMLQNAVRGGTTGIVATPHFMRGRFEVEYNDVVQRVEELKKIAMKNSIDINIYSGQEIYYSKNILQYYNDKIIGTINNTKYMLIELSMVQGNIEEVVDTIYELQLRGIVPIIAHPERYRYFIKNPSMINELSKEGMLFQLNAGSLSGKFGRDVRKTAINYLKNNIYSFIASDAHRDIGRDTDINQEISLLDERQRNIFIENGINMINNNEVNFEGSFIKERKLFKIF